MPLLQGAGPVPDYLYEEGLLYVLIGKACRNANQTIYVDNDNACGQGRAAEYLLNPGPCEDCLIRPGTILFFITTTGNGVYAGPGRAGTPLTASCAWRCLLCRRSRTRPLAALFAREGRPTAVLVSDDILAVALEKACIGPGAVHTGDVSILSFNNSPSRQTPPFRP